MIELEPKATKPAPMIELPTHALAVASPASDVMLSAEEARQIVKNINGRFEQSRKDLIELHDREGWRALGYDNWRDCVQAEFQQSAAYLYRQLAAAKIEQLIESPIGEIPESHLRPVIKAKLNTQETIKRALDRADELAGDQPRTAKHIAQAAAEIAAPDLPIDFSIVQRRLATHGVTLTAKGDTFRLFDRGGAESSTREWSQVCDRLSLLEDGMEEEEEESPAAPVAPAKAACPTCGEPILNGIWGDLKECGSCYHARVRHAPTLADLYAQGLPADLNAAGYYWHSADPPTIALNNSQRRWDAPTAGAAIEAARLHMDAKGEPIAVFPALTPLECKALMREARQFIASGLDKKLPTIGQALRIAARMALEATE